jgi:hypothetical protein
MEIHKVPIIKNGQIIDIIELPTIEEYDKKSKAIIYKETPTDKQLSNS